MSKLSPHKGRSPGDPGTIPLGAAVLLRGTACQGPNVDGRYVIWLEDEAGKYLDSILIDPRAIGSVLSEGREMIEIIDMSHTIEEAKQCPTSAKGGLFPGEPAKSAPKPR